MQWRQEIETRGRLGQGSPYAVDNISIPFDNPWRALLFISGHDFLDDGRRVGVHDAGRRLESHRPGRCILEHVKWRRFASGLAHALGLVIADNTIFVVGRDQITQLHDL